MTHTIHLRDHWTVTPLPHGRVRHARRFGAPRSQDAGETYRLVGTTNGEIEAVFNGIAVEAIIVSNRFQIDLTIGIQPRNLIELHIDAACEINDMAVEILSSNAEIDHE